MDLRRLLENGEYGKIIEILSNKDLQSKEEYFALALSYYNTGKRNKAVNVLKKILQKDPNDLDALFNLAEIFRELEKWNKVKEYVFEYLKRDPNNWAMLDIACDVFAFEGDYEKAIEYLEKAIQRSSSDVKEKLKEKLDILKNRYEQAKKQKKLAFICAYGLDSFIDDIIKGLSNDYWVRKFLVKSNQDVYKTVDWADIVWFEWANEVAIVGTNYPGISSKPTIVRLHSYEVFTNFPLQINWKNVDRLVLVAPHIERILRMRIPDINDKVQIVIIHNGLDIEKIPFKERGPGYNIAWVAHISYKKNPPMMLQIIKKLVEIDPNYKLHVAGDFQDIRYEVYLKYMVKEMGLESSVIFYGWVDDMDEWWEDKNYLLSTSVHESFGYNIAEAMARGIKPVIHNFFGAYELWPKENIFNTIDEAIKIISSKDYNSRSYRKFMERYSLKNQISIIKKLIQSVEHKHYKVWKFDFTHVNKKISMLLPPNDHISKVIIATKTFYELEMLEDIRKRAKPGMIFFDIGANIGNHSLFFALICNAKKVFAFEPNPLAFFILRKNIEINNVKTIVPINIALGDSKGFVEKVFEDPTNLGNTTFRKSDKGEFPMITLDEFVRAYNITCIDILKIDVEGMELEVLKGATHSLKRFKPLLYVELNQVKSNVNDIKKFLQEHGFILLKIFNITPTALFVPKPMTGA